MSERETALKAVRLKAIKLLEALAERCERPEDEDHDWHTCRSCVAAFSLTQPGEKSLLRLLLDELMAAGADPVPVCRWREIATAPKDADLILLYQAGEGVRAGYWDTITDPDRPHWFSPESQLITGGQVQPTHWMPLPAPPVALVPAEET